MSAIFGIYHWQGQPVNPAHLKRMDNALAEHGPDGGAVRVEGALGLGQRLMCFTLEDRLESQPIVSGPIRLVADARIDNRPELAESLGIAAGEAAQLPDSAFILRAYEKWGQECPRHLVGEFAFALWDDRLKQLFAARDGLGTRMLVYHCAAQTFAFATMPTGLLALPFVPRVLNEEKVADYLVGASWERNTTFCQGIERLMPGHQLTVDKNGLKMKRYWSPDLKRKIRFKNDDDYAEAFLEIFDRVTSDYLRSSSRVGIFMSGGLDSSALGASAALIQARQGKRLASFTEVPRVGFDGALPKGRYADETCFVQAIGAQHPNIDLNFIRTTGRGLLDGSEAFFERAMMPMRNVSNRVWWEATLQSAKEQGVRVMLTGEGGNLTVSWRGSGLLVELFRGGKWKRLLTEARASVRVGDARSLGRALLGQVAMPLLPAQLILALENRREKYGKGAIDLNYSPIQPDFARAHKASDAVREAQNRLLYQERAAPKQMRYEILTLLDVFGFIAESYRAMYGVETRLPLYDTRLLEFCLALPEEQWRRNGEIRWLIRRAMANRLPKEVVENKMRGLQAAEWFERLTVSRASIANDLALLEKSDLANRMLDLPRLRRMVEEWPQAGGSGSTQIQDDYRGTLEGGLMVGRFLRWFETGGGA